MPTTKRAIGDTVTVPFVSEESDTATGTIIAVHSGDDSVALIGHDYTVSLGDGGSISVAEADITG